MSTFSNSSSSPGKGEAESAAALVSMQNRLGDQTLVGRISLSSATGHSESQSAFERTATYLNVSDEK
jgi:hypothetical protein